MKTIAILAATAMAAATAPAVAKAPGAVFQAEAPQVIEPGTMVVAADGSELGRLQGSRTNADGVAQVVIMDHAGDRRGIPATAVMLHDDQLHTTWTEAQFHAAPVLVPLAGAAAVASGGNQGPRADDDHLRDRLRMPNPDTAVLEDPTRRTVVEQQQVPVRPE